MESVCVQHPSPSPTLGSGNRLLLSAAARTLPPLRSGRPVHPSSLLLWILPGLRGPDGCRIFLRGLRVGASWTVPPEDLREFFARLSARPDANPPALRTPAQRQRAA